jgi:UDP:flavonoid glycosyltransferase YjiC (YdhE family)
MARIVLTCWGSHGDVDPFLGLGLGLRQRGHQVTIATLEYYRTLIEGAGLSFAPIRPGIDPTDTAVVHRIMHPTRGSEYLLTEILFPAIDDMFDDVNAAAEGADLLVSHPVTFATPIVAEHRRMPWASAVLAPTSLFSGYDLPILPGVGWLKSLPQFGGWPGALVIALIQRATARWSEPVYRLRQRIGLPRGANPLIEGQHSPRLVLALFSRVLADPQPDWPKQTVVTGHVFHDAPHGTTLSEEMEAFLRSGPPPIVFTLGSSVVLIADRFWRESIEATRRLHARAVLLAGPEQAPQLRDQLNASARDSASILVVDRAPHSLLFPRASVVVQQCGIGTLAQSLRSGRPMLGVPYAHDQPDNAWRAVHLGIARSLRPQAYRAARVERELRALMDERYEAAAGRVARVVRDERGVETACEAIERRFDLRQ